MRREAKIVRLAEFLLVADEDWVSFEEARSETDAKRMLDSPEVHKTDKGYGRGPAPAVNMQNVPRGTNEEVVPRWVADEKLAAWLKNKRPELNASKIYDELEEYSDLEARKMALHWTLNKGIVSPREDKEKVMRALEMAKQKGLNPKLFKSPLEITETQAVKESTSPRLNPDTIPELSNKRELPEGVVYYQVDDTREGQQAMRKLIDSYYGDDANPWCTVVKGNDGNLTEESWDRYNNTYGGTKYVGFQDGKMLGFYGKGKWWDRMDLPTDGIPIATKLQNDKLGRKAISEMDMETGIKGELPLRVFKGDPRNGYYSEWYPETVIGGKDGVKKLEGTNKEGKIVGEFKKWHPNGKIEEISHYDPAGSGILSGKFNKFWENGNPELECSYTIKNGHQDFSGDYVSYYSNGTIERECTFEKNGSGSQNKVIGTEKSYYPNGDLFSEEEYSDKGVLLRSTSYFEDGEVKEDRTYRDPSEEKLKRYDP